MKVSSLASELLSEKNIHAFKQNALSVAYSRILNNVVLKRSFIHLLDIARNSGADLLPTNNMVKDTEAHIHENTSSCLLGSSESGCEDVLAEDTAGDDYEAAVTRISIDNPASRWHYPEVYGR